MAIERLDVRDLSVGEATAKGVLGPYPFVIKRRKKKYILFLGVATADGVSSFPYFEIEEPVDKDSLAVSLANYVAPEHAAAIANTVAQIIENWDVYEFLGQARSMEARVTDGIPAEHIARLSTLAATVKPRPKEELAEHLANIILENMNLLTIHENINCYKDGIYVVCEDEMPAVVERAVAQEELRKILTNHVVNEVLGKIRRRTYASPEVFEKAKFTLAFKNGLLDIKRYVETGTIELLGFDPSRPALHRIPHALRLDLYEEAVKPYPTLQRLAEPLPLDEIARRIDPVGWRVFSQWVGEDMAPILYEIIGYALYPDYPLQVAFMLVGEGANGKSTYLKLVEDIIGPANTSHIKLQDLAGKQGNRFAPAELYRKLANIFADLPATMITEDSMFKTLTGGDVITAERKFHHPFKFVNYAKMIFAANKLPIISDSRSYAFWRRWILVEFPNRFKPDPHFYARVFTEEEKERILVVSLIALRNVMIRGEFTRPKEGVEDLRERWLRQSLNTYRFIREMEEQGHIAITGDPDDYVLKDDLYNAYVNWCSVAGEEPVKKARFTEHLERIFGIRSMRRRVAGSLKYVYVGIKASDRLGAEETKDLTSYT